ncbi:MAG: DegV family protein, partial [Oscillospiraceae bacterium]|nr:DegV family protein [Oscillospiraceae bacterium]
MGIHIISDSCCDTTSALQKALNLDIASLKINIAEGQQYIDDENLDTQRLLADMKASKAATGTACPSPEEYAEHMRKYKESFVITLSSKLSGSFNAATIGAQLALEDMPENRVHVLDSESASAGQTR